MELEERGEVRNCVRFCIYTELGCPNRSVRPQRSTPPSRATFGDRRYRGRHVLCAEALGILFLTHPSLLATPR